jgi:lipopolysaccharide transport protein LptA
VSLRHGFFLWVGLLGLAATSAGQAAGDPTAPVQAGGISAQTKTPDGKGGEAKGGSDAQVRRAAERLGLDLTSGEAPLEINAGRQTLRERPDGGRISAWTGDVVLTQGDLKLSCQKLEIAFASEAAGGAVEKIEAEGSVAIVQKEVELRCDRAIYDQPSCKAVCERIDACKKPGALADPALLRQGKDTVRGGRIEFDVCSGDFQVSCGASGFFTPRKPDAKPGKSEKSRPDKPAEGQN